VDNDDGGPDGEPENDAQAVDQDDDTDNEHDEHALTKSHESDDSEPETENNNDMIARDMDAKYGARTRAYNLQARHQCDCSHLYMIVSEQYNPVDEVLMTQYGVKKSIQLYGDAGVTAIMLELQQLHDQMLILPVMASSLSESERKAILAYLVFLKDKCTGVIYVCGCADGRKQWLYTAKEDVSSPTVAIESVLFITSVIDAMENRDVATVDVPGAFMQVNMDEVIHMRLEGMMAELLIKISPETYGKYATTE
jgi:hypothetical protein